VNFLSINEKLKGYCETSSPHQFFTIKIKQQLTSFQNVISVASAFTMAKFFVTTVAKILI
jgi:hypothetical protein